MKRYAIAIKANNISNKLYFSEVIYIILFNILIFQTPLQNMNPIFKNTDEIISTIFFIRFIITKIKAPNNLKLVKEEVIIFILLVLMLFLGVMGNVLSGVNQVINAILIDIGNFFKFFMVYLGVISYVYLIRRNVMLRILSTQVKVYTVITLIFGVVNLFIDISMTYDVRYGIRSFQFIHGHPGTLSTVCVYYLIILTADLYYRNRKSTKISIFFNLIILLLTLRSKSFAFVGIYCFIYYVTMKSIKIKVKHFIFIAIISLVISGAQIKLYFGSELTPRLALLKGGINNCIKYFPIGSGFGTYGSFAAAKYYSSLYYDLGFNNMYGMSKENPYFLNDNFCSIILGQFGLIGALIFSIIIYYLVKLINERGKGKETLKMAAFIGIVFLIISMITDTSFSHYLSIAIFFILPLILKGNERKI